MWHVLRLENQHWYLEDIVGMSGCCVIIRNMLIKINYEDLFESKEPAGAPVDAVRKFFTQVDPVHVFLENSGVNKGVPVGRIHTV